MDVHQKMNTARSLIPIGAAALLPATAQRVRHLEETVLGYLRQWGYREIIPPTFEYLDVLSAGLPAHVLEKCFKFADWTTGRILVLRPDVTAQVARIVAMGMGGTGVPLRLCYRSTVFRYEPEHAGRDREIFQVGVELIGLDDPYVDAELLLLVVELMKTIGLPDFTVSLGHVGFYKALLAQSGMSPDNRREAEYAAAHKDLPRLEHVLARERVPRRLAQALLETPERYGREDVLAWGQRIAGQHRTLRAPLSRLAKVYRLLEEAGCSSHVILDLGEFRGFDYYDGLVFDVFTSTGGREVGGGGRYNHLIGRFGRDWPSTGFALDIDRLFTALMPTDPSADEGQWPLILMSPARLHAQAWKLAQRLRGAGQIVIQETIPAPEISMRQIRARTQQAEASAIVAMGAADLARTEALIAFIRPAAKSLRFKKIAVNDVVSVLEQKSSV